MSKFRIKMKLTGLELEIEGSRDEMPQISRNLGQQLAGLLQPAAGIVEGEVVEPGPPAAAPPPAIQAGTPPAPSDNGAGTARKRGARKRRGTSGGASGGAGAGAGPAAATTTESIIDFTHNAATYGSPRQDWNTSQKSLWLLYVMAEQANRRELTVQQIAATFNRYFREAGQILVQNVARDLGKQRARGKEAPVAEDATMDPSPWYLTELGRREAQTLVAQALERTTTAAGPAAAGDAGPLEG